jgi:hypothetical protein
MAESPPVAVTGRFLAIVSLSAMCVILFVVYEHNSSAIIRGISRRTSSITVALVSPDFVKGLKAREKPGDQIFVHQILSKSVLATDLPIMERPAK